MAGDGTRELFVGHKKSCERVAAELETAYRDGEFVGGLGRDALLAERDQLRAEAEQFRELAKANADALGKALAELEGIRGQQPDWCKTMERPKSHCGCPDCGSSLVEVNGLPPLQPDAWPTLDKPAKVGPVRFNPGLSARLVVEAAQRQHEYSQQPEVEAARLERFGAFMREVHGENGDGGASDGP